MTYNYRNLVFEGGGVKGIAYGGALEVLDEMNILAGLKRVAGTSAGAINATLLALGYSSSEVSKIVAETNFGDFEDHNRFPLKNIIRLLKRYGWNKGDAFKEQLGEWIANKTGHEDITFAELNEEITGDNQHNYKHLYVAATNLSKQKRQVFSHESDQFPDTSIRDAVRMSMSIPLFFQAVNFKGDVMADGGVSYNYPLDLFDNVKYLDDPSMGEKQDYFQDVEGFVFNHETLGFRLDSKEVIHYSQDNWANVPVEIDGFKGYATGLLEFLMEMANKSHLHQNDWFRTIFIDTLNVKTTEFDLSQEKIENLLNSGRKHVKEYFINKTTAKQS